jgi:hypothetical protein
MQGRIRGNKGARRIREGADGRKNRGNEEKRKRVKKRGQR